MKKYCKCGGTLCINVGDSIMSGTFRWYASYHCNNCKINTEMDGNGLHEQLCMAYPSYKKFFEDIGRPTALYFFGEYPYPVHLRGKTAAEILSEIENIERFPNASRLTKFTGIVPVNFSSAGKGKDMCPKQGNRRYFGNISRRKRK